MYCSDPDSDSEYDLDEAEGSEQTTWQEVSDEVFLEDEFDNNDGETANRNYELRTVIPDTPPCSQWRMTTTMKRMHMASVLLEIKRYEMEQRQLNDQRTMEQMFAQERLELVKEEGRLAQANLIEMEKNKKINETNAEWHEYLLACANGDVVTEKPGSVVDEMVVKPLPVLSAAKKAQAKAHLRAVKDKMATKKAPRRKVCDETTPEFKEQIKKMEMQQSIARASRQKTAQRAKRVAEAARALKFSLMTADEIRSLNETKNEYIMPRGKLIIMDDDDIEDEEATITTARFYEETIKKIAVKVVIDDSSEWTTVGPKVGPQVPLVIKMGAAPYRKFVEDGVRQEAFTKLADVKKIGAQLTFTRMCESVASGKVCRHGAKCNFAHTMDQLQVGQCAFADQCRLVSKEVCGTWYSNCNKKVCRFQHAGETKENVFKRNGVVVPNVTPVVAIATPVAVAHSVIIAPIPRIAAWVKPIAEIVVAPIVVAPIAVAPIAVASIVVAPIAVAPIAVAPIAVAPIAVASIAMIPPPKTEKKVCAWYAKGVACPHGTKCRFSHNTPVTPSKMAWSQPLVIETPVVIETQSNALIIIRVPAELAMQALEMMLKQGKTNVKIEIV